MRDRKIFLHHLAGAADFVADRRSEIGRKQTGKCGLNPVALAFVPRGDFRIERRQRGAIAAGGGDAVGGR
jgi:hypothetical protein